MKISRVAAKIAVRLMLFLILLALVPLFTGGSLDKQLQHIYFITNNKWVLAYPIVLILGFIGLLVTCSIQKYSKPDINWLLVLNTIVLITYGISVFIRISHLVK